jgi:CheY-like chemotaxis protein/two-component sensor histidine kinase
LQFATNPGEAKQTDRISLQSIIIGVEQQLELKIQDTKATINVDLQTDEIYGDFIIIQQVFANIVGNALKYCPDSRTPIIDISSKLVEENVIISFKDNGIGIEKDKLGKVFGEMVRIDNELSDVEGQGIGLSTVKRLLENYNGTIEVESTHGVGSIFRVTLPVVDLLSTTESSHESVGDMGKILVIEDDIDLQSVYSTYLTDYSKSIQFSSDGVSGLQEATNKKFDLIIIDINVPKLDGISITNKIREFQKITDIEASQIVISSATTDEKIISKCFSAGANSFLKKPFKKMELLSAIERARQA